MQIDNRYWAGIFDGEGHIYFSRDLVHIKVSLNQKEPGVLYLLRNRFRGAVYHKKRGIPQWECFSKKDMIPFLRAITPYLIIKRVEAEIALEALSGWLESRYYSGGLNKALPKEEMDRRRALKEKFDADRSNPKSSPIL